MIALPFPFLVAEFVLFVFLASRFGFAPVFFAYALPSLVGLLLLALRSRTALFSVQTGLARDRDPGPEMLNSGAKFFGALLLIAPFFSTRVLGVLLSLPGTRHLMLFLFRSWIFKRFRDQGLFGNFGAGPGMGAGGFHFRSYRFDGRGFRETSSSGESFATTTEREVSEAREVLDVVPLEIEHSDSPPRSETDSRV